MKKTEELKIALLKMYEEKCMEEKAAAEKGSDTREFMNFGGSQALKNFGFLELDINYNEFESIRAKYFPDEN